METFVKKVDKFSHQSPSSTIETACVPMPQPVARCAALPSVLDLMTADAVTKAAAAAPHKSQQITPPHNTKVVRIQLVSPAQMAAAPKTGEIQMPESENFQDKLKINLIEMRKVMQTQFDEHLENVMNQKNRQLQAKDRQLQMKDRQLQAWQSKFTAMHHHATLLAKEVAKQDLMLTALKDSETKAQSFYITQKEVVKASIALANRDRKTKFVMAHTVTYAATAPTADVYDEVSAAARRQLEELRQAKSEEIASLALKVEELARVYSPHRYNLPTPTNVSVPKVVDDVDNLPEAVPAELFAIWMTQGGEHELTKEEEQKFSSFLEKLIRLAPVFSPDLPRIRVNWTALNPFQHRNLPKPTMFPVRSCSLDPQFYKRTEQFYAGSGHYRTVLSWEQPQHKYPFGHLYGFNTNMGIVAVPGQPMHGYRCDKLSGEWYIDARG